MLKSQIYSIKLFYHSKILFSRRRKKDNGFEDDGFIDDSVGRHKSSIKKEDTISTDKRKKEEEARRKRIANAKKAPPPVDFNSLLKLANEKKDIPVKIEKKVEKKDGEFGDRPMTKREKEEFMRDNEARLRREGKLPPKERSPAIMEKKSRGSSEEKIERLPEKLPKIRAEPGPSFHSAVLKTMPPPEKRKHDSEMSEAARQMKELEMKMKDLEKKKEELETKSKVEEYNRKKRLEYERKKEAFEREKMRQLQSEKQERRKLDQDKKKLEEMQQRYKEMQRQLQEKEQRLSSGGSKRDINTVESRHFPGERKRRDDGGRDSRRFGGGGGGGRRIESDSEDYDSEMDDFIDDTDAKVDISAEIRNIFG